MNRSTTFRNILLCILISCVIFAQGFALGTQIERRRVLACLEKTMRTATELNEKIKQLQKRLKDQQNSARLAWDGWNKSFATCQYLRRSNAALRGVITKLKRKLAK